MDSFELDEMRGKLHSTSSQERIYFMLLTCERMMPNFETFSGETGFGDAKVLRSALDAIWEFQRSGNLFDDIDGLCCTNPVRDSSCESSVIAGGHEQTEHIDLQDAELARV